MCPDCGGVFHRWQHVRSWTAPFTTRKIETIFFLSKIDQTHSMERLIKRKVDVEISRKYESEFPKVALYLLGLSKSNVFAILNLGTRTLQISSSGISTQSLRLGGGRGQFAAQRLSRKTSHRHPLEAW